MTPIRYIVGCDLGQQRDYTAVAVLRRSPAFGETQAAEYDCVHLQRYPLGTKYPAIVESVEKMLCRPEMIPEGCPHPVLAIDATGVGRAVVDLFLTRRFPAEVRPISITGGSQVTAQPWIGPATRAVGFTVPKRDLVSSVQALLQTGRLRIVPTLPEADTLRTELLEFRVKVSINTAHESFEAHREGAHDDLVLAVAMAAWIGERSEGPRRSASASIPAPPRPPLPLGY